MAEDGVSIEKPTGRRPPCANQIAAGARPGRHSQRQNGNPGSAGIRRRRQYRHVAVPRRQQGRRPDAASAPAAFEQRFLVFLAGREDLHQPGDAPARPRPADLHQGLVVGEPCARLCEFLPAWPDDHDLGDGDVVDATQHGDDVIACQWRHAQPRPSPAWECGPPGSAMAHIASPAQSGLSVMAMSPSETMPTRRFLRLGTGRRRTLMSARWWAASSISSSSKQYITLPLLITSRILVLGFSPLATARTTMSRSVIMPTSRSLSPTGSTPASMAAISLAASWMLWFGLAIWTSGVIASLTLMSASIPIIELRIETSRMALAPGWASRLDRHGFVGILEGNAPLQGRFLATREKLSQCGRNGLATRLCETGERRRGARSP